MSLPLPVAMFSSKLREESIDGSLGGGRLGGGLVEAFTPELKEKMVRLEKQKQLLWKRVEDAESVPEEGEVCDLRNLLPPQTGPYSLMPVIRTG